MIPCSTCSFANPMGTRWCRQCGAKLELDAKQIEASVSATNAATADGRWLEHGRSALGIGGFVLVTTIILRVALVPTLPRADIPTQLPAQVVPLFERTSAPALVAGPGNTVIASERLRWRAATCRVQANSLGLDLAALDLAHERLLKAQKADGSFAGSDPLAATGLALLGLQAWPTDDGLAAAAKGRVWLNAQLADPSRRQPLGRALALAALEDAQELSAGARARLIAYVIDGKAARWQAWMLAGVPAADRPAELGLISDGLARDQAETDWLPLLALGSGKRPEIDAKHYFSEAAAGIAGIDRLPWTLLAWQLTPAPLDLVEVLKGWSRAPVPALGDELSKVAGPTAADAVWLMTLAAPSRLPPLWTGIAVP